MKKKLLPLLLCAAMVFSLAAGCSSNTPAATDTPTPTPEETVDPAPTETVSGGAGDRAEVSLGLLKGPTGMGAAKLLTDNANGESALAYQVTLGADPANDIVPLIVKGELDVAAVPTNLAATLYHKTEGGIKLLALNTLGVLHILENGSSVNSLADLAGRTIYAPNKGSNTEYVLNYLLEQNGLTPGEDVTIEWRTSDEVSALMAAGEIDLCMLPVPAATSVMIQNKDVRDAVDLNDAWAQSGAAGILTMGCLIARAEWVEANPEAVETLLSEYAASIDYVINHVEEAAAMMETHGIVPKAAVAKAAIPQAGLTYVAGDDLKDISSYYEVLYAADPTSIGGSIPDDNFYYIP